MGDFDKIDILFDNKKCFFHDKIFEYTFSDDFYFNRVVLDTDDMQPIKKIDSLEMPNNLYRFKVMYRKYDLTSDSLSRQDNYFCVVLTAQVDIEKLKSNDKYACVFFEKMLLRDRIEEFSYKTGVDDMNIFLDDSTGNYVGSMWDDKFMVNDRLAKIINNSFLTQKFLNLKNKKMK